MSPSAMLAAHLRQPPAPGCVALASGSRCWVCAGIAPRGILRSKWQGANFTGQNKVRCPSSDHVCEPCVQVMAGRPPDTFRMYSHLFDGGRGEYHRFNKGDKPAMRSWLRAWHVGPWFAAIADSGQKHIVPWCPINPPGSAIGRVLFEETLVQLPGPDGWALVDALAQLLTDGATKEETGRGEYGSGAWTRCPSSIVTFENQYGSLRGSGWFDLALWLAQRDEATVQTRMAAEKQEREEKAKHAKVDRGRTRSVGSGNSRRRNGVPKNGADERREPAETVGPIDVPTASVGADDGPTRGVVIQVHAGPSAKRPVQGTLFGDPIPGPNGRSKRRRVARPA